MAFILEAILTGWIDPLLWYKSMSTLYIQKNKKLCFGAFVMNCLLLIFKQFITNTTQNSFIQIILMVGIQVYLIIVTVFLFEGCFLSTCFCTVTHIFDAQLCSCSV